MILDIIGVLRAWDYVLGSPLLTTDEKREIAAELKQALPAQLLCSKAKRTHAITHDLIGRTYDSTPGIPTEEAPSQEVHPKEHQLPARSAGQDGVSRDDRKAYGGSAKVERGKRKASFADAGPA